MFDDNFGNFEFDQMQELSQNSFDRINEIIEYSPYSSTVLVKRFKLPDTFIKADPEKKIVGDPWGYEVPGKSRTLIKPVGQKEEDLFEFKTKCYIVYTPKRNFLKRIGIFWDEKKDNLPIVAFFKSTDDIKFEDILLVQEHDTGAGYKDKLMPRKLKVTNLLSEGTLYQFINIYQLAPMRDKL